MMRFHYPIIVAIGFATFFGTRAGAQVIIERDRTDADVRAEQRRAAAAAAHAEVTKAETQVKTATDRVRTTWKANPELIAAERELADAQAAVEKAREPVLAKLAQDPKYRALKDEEARAAAEVKQEQARTNSTQPATTQPAGTNEKVPNLPPPSQDQVAAATEKLNHRTRLRDMEEAALAADPDAKAATDRLEKARDQMKVLQRQLDAALQNDPEFRAARDALAAARAHAAEAAR